MYTGDMTKTKVHTWADGFGRWHARVTVGPTAARRAREAIRKEIVARGECGPGWRCRIELEGLGGAGQFATFGERV